MFNLEMILKQSFALLFTTISLTIASIALFFPSPTKAYGECDQYGLMATYNSYSRTCTCMTGYAFKNNLFGDPACVSLDSICTDELGYSARYDHLRDRCACRTGSVIYNGKCTSGSSICMLKHGYHSEFNDLNNACECSSGYTMDTSDQCVQKQNNVYFRLKELDTDAKKAIIQSTYDNRYYQVTYNSGCYSSSFRRYLNQNIVINLGTDYDLDRWDKIVLQDDDEVCDITQRERVDSSATLATEDADESALILPQCPMGQIRLGNACYSYDVGCMLSFGNNAKWTRGFNSKGQYTCDCKSGFQWNDDGQSCSLIPPRVTASTTTTDIIFPPKERGKIDMIAFCKTTLGKEAIFDAVSGNCACPPRFEIKEKVCSAKTKAFVGMPKTKKDLLACDVIINKNSKLYYLRGHKSIQQMTLAGKECVASEQIAKGKKYKAAK